MLPRRVEPLIALVVCAALYAAMLVARGITPADEGLGARIEGHFREGDGWYPGEAFVTARPVRAWGSWCGDDDHQGALTVGPFPAPARLRFGVGGYPTKPGIELLAENTATGERVPIRTGDVHETWRIVDVPLPASWHRQPVLLVARDSAVGHGGWIAITEPIRGGPGDGHLALLETLAAWASNGLLLGALWLAALRALARLAASRATDGGTDVLPRPWWPLLAAGAVALGGYATFWGYFVHPHLGRAISFGLFLGAAVVLWRTRRDAREPLRAAFGVGRIAVVIGVLYLALLHLFPTPLGFYELAASRFRDALPADNLLPHLIAERLHDATDLREPLGDWRSSDRPPLQGGWQLLTWPVLRALGFPATTASGTAAVWFQLTWVAAAAGFLGALGLPARRRRAWLALMAGSGFFLQHTVFTWPKLSAGALACGAFGLWLWRARDDRCAGEKSPGRATPGRPALLLGGALAALAWLAHGGVAFSFLALAPWIAWRCARGEWRAWLQAALVFAVIVAPWTAYQKLYDPPGNRLLKWHLAGQIPIDGRGTLQTLRENYAALTPAQWLENKRVNFAYQTHGTWSLLLDVSAERARDRRNEEFSHTARALTWWIAALLAVPLALGRLARGEASASSPRLLWTLPLWAAGTIVLWCVLLFDRGAAVVHHGSYAAMIALFVAGSAWLDLAGRWSPAVLGVLQGVAFASTWVGGNAVVGGAVNPSAAAIALSAAAVLVGVVLAALRGPRAGTPGSAEMARAASPEHQHAAEAGHARASRGLVALAAIAALLPFAWCWRNFADLWWFGDDWDLLDRMTREGFWRWVMNPFAESVVPLFKALWGGLVLAGSGSYLPMIAALWITHAVNAALVVALLRRANFGGTATAFAVALFALSAANIETLGWSVQWSAMLAIAFFLAAAIWLLPRLGDARADGWASCALLAALSGASALSFARGVLTGPALAALCVLPIAGGTMQPRWRAAAACLLPAIAVAATIYAISPGNHRSFRGHELEAVQFGLAYWAGTPLHRLLEFEGWEARTVIVLGGLKLALVVWTLRRATGPQRALLLLLLLLDLGNAVLLGVGRYHTGLPASNSERYYYVALLCTLPFLGLAFEHWLRALPSGRAVRMTAAALIVVLAVRAARGWPRASGAFADGRGRHTRELLLRHPQPPAEGAVPGIPFLPTARAKELIAIYNLH